MDEMSNEDRELLFRKFDRTEKIARFVAWVVSLLVLGTLAAAVGWRDVKHDIESTKLAVEGINSIGSTALRAHIEDEGRARGLIRDDVSEMKTDVKWLVRELAPRGGR